MHVIQSIKSNQLRWIGYVESIAESKTVKRIYAYQIRGKVSGRSNKVCGSNRGVHENSANKELQPPTPQ